MIKEDDTKPTFLVTLRLLYSGDKDRALSETINELEQLHIMQSPSVRGTAFNNLITSTGGKIRSDSARTHVVYTKLS